jgi:hypothetical protein
LNALVLSLIGLGMALQFVGERLIGALMEYRLDRAILIDRLELRTKREGGR